MNNIKIEKNTKIISKVTHQGKWIVTENIEIDCYVTNDSKRLLSLRGTARAMDLKGGGSGGLLRNLKSLWIQPYLSDHLKSWINGASMDEIDRISGIKGPAFIPFEASLFVDVCQAYVQAKNDGILNDTQSATADRLLGIMSAFAKVGIVAIVDEITGFQEVRKKDALRELLEMYLINEYAIWAKRFPDEFFKEIFRLKEWSYDALNVKRPSVVGRYINDIVYERLAPNILEELRSLNPSNEKGYRKVRHHQFLTEDIGHPALSQHIYALLGLMRSSREWDSFYRSLQRAYPKKNEQILIDFEY